MSSAPALDTKLIGKPDHINGDPTKFGDWSFELKSYMRALDSRYQQLFAETEQSAVPILNVTRDLTEATLNAQLYCVFFTSSAATTLESTKDSRRGASSQLSGSRSSRICTSGCCCKAHSSSTVTCLQGSLHLNVWRVTTKSSRGKQWTMISRWRWPSLDVHGSIVKEHLIRNTAPLDSWIKSRARKSTHTHSQHQCNWEPRPRARGRGKGRRKERPKQRHRHRHLKPKRDNHPKQRQKAKSLATEKVSFYCKKNGHVRSDCRKRQQNCAAAGGRPVPAATAADAG